MSEQHPPVKRAVALLYDPAKGTAPKVIASGANRVADTIIATASAAGVPVREDRDLVELLSKVPIGTEIPVELYQTIAEVLAFVYLVNNRYKSKLGRSNDPGK